MGPKKGFEAFLKKNQKKGSKAAAKTEETVAQDQEQKADDQKAQEEVKNTPETKAQNNNQDDESEEDELDLVAKQQVSYGTTKENKDIAQKKEKNDDLVGYGLDEGKEEKKAAEAQPKKKLAFGEGAAFGRPTFGGRKPKADGTLAKENFDDGLDDLDNPQASKKDSKKGPVAEESKTESKGPVKPTFRGKMNVGGRDRENDDSTGVKTNYDFGVVYSKKRDGEEGGDKEGDGKRHENQGDREQNRKPRQKRDHGVEFGKEKKAADDDDDFTLVRDTKTRPKRKQQVDSDSDAEEESRGRGGFRGARVQRGGERGGRGGWFKNSSKKQE